MVQPKNPPKSARVEEQESMQKFFDEYKELCQKYQCQIVVTPAYKVSQDTGVWGTVLQTGVGKLPKVDN